MANTIKLKRASGSDPGASDLVVGEVALRTDTAKLFTKKDDNSVAEIGVTALGNNDVTTSTIADNAVTFAKLEDVENNRILGRVLAEPLSSKDGSFKISKRSVALTPLSGGLSNPLYIKPE